MSILSKAFARNKNHIAKAIGPLSKAVALIPGVGGVASAALKGLGGMIGKKAEPNKPTVGPKKTYNVGGKGTVSV